MAKANINGEGFASLRCLLKAYSIRILYELNKMNLSDKTYNDLKDQKQEEVLVPSSPPIDLDEGTVASASDVVKIAIKQRVSKHQQLLDQLLEEIQPADLRKLAGLKEESAKLLKSDIVVQTIKLILKTARRMKLGLCKNGGFVYVYNGQYWVSITSEELERFLGQAAAKIGVGNIAEYFRFKEELLKQFMSAAYLPKPDTANDLVKINFLNGTFEITPDEQTLREFRSEDFITYQLPFAYDTNATSPMFEQYLNTVQPDEENQKILAEYLGYLFVKSSYLKLEKVLLIYGSGSNGKSVFFEIVNALLGGGNNISNFSLQSLTNENGYYRAKLANVLLNYASEINGKLEGSIFKLLASGEPVEARLPYHEPFTITDYAKLIFNCNILPSEVEQTHAFYRRFKIVPFQVTVSASEADPQLAKKIIAVELSGIFNWVLKGLHRLLAQGCFTESASGNAQLDLYKMQSDSVAMFVHETGYKKSINSFITFSEMYDNYKDYCDENTYRKCSARTFGERIRTQGFTVERKNKGNMVYATMPNGA